MYASGTMSGTVAIVQDLVHSLWVNDVNSGLCDMQMH